MKLKVCGLREPQHIEQISRLDIDYIGFHFHKASPGFIGDRIGFDFVRSIPKRIRKVGVFVNEDPYSIFSAVARYDLDLVQLQGNESHAVCRELKPYVKVVKAFELTENFNFKILENYLPYVDYVLFDRRNGSGSSLDYEALQHYPYELPFFLSGDISRASLHTIEKLRCRQFFALDLNPEFETQAGINEPSEIGAFIKRFRQTKHADQNP